MTDSALVNQSLTYFPDYDHTVTIVGGPVGYGGTWSQDPAFQQPGRVRLYYGGALVSDIRWTAATVDQPIDDRVFVLDGK